MQGQRGIIGTNTLDFDHGPTPTNDIIGQQIFWNSVRNPGEDRMTDFMNLNDAIGNPVGQEHQSLGGWNLGESSSSGGQIEVNHNDQKLEHLWSSSTISSVENGPRLEDNINLNRQIIRSHNPDVVPQNFNLNTSFVDHGYDNFQVTEDPNGFKISGLDDRSSSGVPNPPLFPSRTSRLVLGDNDGRPGCSLDGRRTPCKRKAVEGNIGQSSLSGSSSFFQHPEAPWLQVPGLYDAGSSLSIPVASQSTMPRLDLGSRGGSSSSNFESPLTVQPEGSHRNLRLRINPSNQESVPATLFATGSAVRHSVVPHPHPSSRLLAVNHYELGSSPSVDIIGNQIRPSETPVPGLPQSGQSLRWNESSSARTGGSLTPVSLADREDANPRSSTRSLLEHQFPLHLNDLRNLARSSITRNLAAGVAGSPGNVASSSRSGSSSGSHPLAARSLVPPPNVSSRSSRRLAEYVRRSLFTSTVPGSGGQGDLHPTLHLQPSASSTSSSEEPPAASIPVHHRSHPRPAAWMDRQGEGIGIPYPLRTLAVGGEGRSRQVSEQIRNVLDLMRRGEGLRLEDVMMLDQSVFFGVADIHDRHRDMRLDVDNMSYEELLALEERIGNVNTGLSEETIMKLLKQREYSVALRSEVEAEPCCVCQEEYNDGENVGTLDCGHNFHTACIKQWLMLKNWCPICKTTGLAAS